MLHPDFLGRDVIKELWMDIWNGTTTVSIARAQDRADTFAWRAGLLVDALPFFLLVAALTDEIPAKFADRKHARLG